MDSESADTRLGRATLTPEGPVVAGTVGQWTLQLTVGSYGIDEGGTIKIARRFASDWERPQFDEPSAPAFTTVSTDGEAKLAARYDPKAHVRPWMKCVVIDVYDGSLAPGDTVTIVFGDQSGGSPGIRAQSFIESKHEMRVLVDPTNACLVRRIPSSPTFAIVSGPPETVVVHVPSRSSLGKTVEVFVKGEDHWGNPTPAPDDTQLAWEGEGEGALAGRRLSANACGTGRVVATWRGESVRSNPLTITESAPTYAAYWADLHAQSDATVGTGTEVEYFAFGRDWAHLDVMSHQGNDFQVTDEDWARLNAVVRDFHEDGRFVVFPGFEWSANSPAGGDRNVIYLDEDAPILRSSHWQVYDHVENDQTPAHPASGLFERLRAHVDPERVLVAAHCGGRYADIRKYHDESLEKLVEVASCWGVFEWLLWDAFDHGYRVGVMCNSDGHKGRPGAERPGAGQFGIFGGLTCILAESLTRESVFAALRARRCYGTTGPRIDLRFAVDGHDMGSEFSAGERVRVQALVHGTGPVESLQLFRGKDLVRTLRAEAFDASTPSRRVRLMWGGARIRGRGRRAVWDGTIHLEGAKLTDVQPVAFDSPADAVESWNGHEVRFRSRTTGDVDGVDLWLDDATQGRLVFDTDVGSLAVELAQLDSREVVRQFGGLGLHVRVVRYPEVPTQMTLELDETFEVEPGVTTPLFVKAVQCDGEMAWSSPVYVTRPR